MRSRFQDLLAKFDGEYRFARHKQGTNPKRLRDRPSNGRRLQPHSQLIGRANQNEMEQTGSFSPLNPVPRESDLKSSEISTSPLADYTVEREAFAQARAKLLHDYPGKYVVFVGEQMIGPHDSFPAAVRAARLQHGRIPIYTKQLIEDDSVR